MPLTPGDRLGPHEIFALIGEGGMGEVWKARDTRLDRTVAVKVSKAEFTERFEREARSVAAMNHPHICQLYDIGPNYLVMEFIEGTPLKGPLLINQAVEYAAQILDALDAAHQRGIVHRDLKPANILVTKQGIKLLDFGLAKQAAPLQESDATVTRALTGKGQILGTLQYMSPEQLQGQDATLCSDLFSFGCVFYEMLTGVRAFDGENAASVITHIMSAPPAPLRVAGVPPAMERLLRVCLEKDPADRWQSARDLRRELRWAASAHMSGPIATAPAPRRRYAWIPVAVAGLALGVGAMWMLRRPQPELPVRLSIVPPENGTVTAFSISPDENSLAFPVEKDRKTQIWVRRLDSDVAERVAGTEGANADEVPAWSPDGEHLAFADGEMLKLVTVRGGKVRELTRGRNRGITWNADGTILFVDFAQGIRRIPAAGGRPEKLAGLDLDGAIGSRFPAFMPDGHRFLFLTRGTAFVIGSSVRAGSLDGKTNKRILARQATAAGVVVEPGGSSGWLVYERDGSLLVQRFSPKSLELEGKPVTVSDAVGLPSGATGRSFFAASNRAIAYRAPESLLVRLVLYDAAGKRVRELGEPGRFTHQVRLSANGRQALLGSFDMKSHTRNIETVDSSSGVFTRRTFDADADDAIWSNDGHTIFFIRQGSDKTQIYESPADWSARPQLVKEVEGVVHLWDVSADRKTLLLFTTLANARTLTRGPSSWEFDRVLNDEPFRKGKFSPDGQWVVYQTAGTGLYATAWPPTGAKSEISPDGAEPVWGRDGKEIYFLRGEEITAVSVDTSDRSLKVGPPRTLFRATVPPATIPGHRFDVTADGKMFLVWERVPEPPGVPFTVLLNWKSLMSKQ